MNENRIFNREEDSLAAEVVLRGKLGGNEVNVFIVPTFENTTPASAIAATTPANEHKRN
ncbi:MAG: hypothetical protein LBJ67_14225 [Planctomycetaceae bacterium]|nr:hypothetical protein [Planctomycetaceae bacterium]